MYIYITKAHLFVFVWCFTDMKTLYIFRSLSRLQKSSDFGVLLSCINRSI